jgi:hypothetical protein
MKISLAHNDRQVSAVRTGGLEREGEDVQRAAWRKSSAAPPPQLSLTGSPLRNAILMMGHDTAAGLGLRAPHDSPCGGTIAEGQCRQRPKDL